MSHAIDNGVHKEYNAKLDSKRRLVIRGDREELHERYFVRHHANGVIELRPQKMVDVASISDATLDMIDKSMENLKKGVASSPIDLNKKYPNI
jgi:hypothetical protein